jgi:hypothetical protein
VRRVRHRAKSLQMASLSWRYHSLVRAVVPEVSQLICAQAEMALERGLLIHSSCIWRWVQIYGPELDKRCRAHLKVTDKSHRVDQTYIRIKAQGRYLYRAVNSTGQSIYFLLTAKRDASVAKRFFRTTVLDPANPQPRVTRWTRTERIRRTWRNSRWRAHLFISNRWANSQAGRRGFCDCARTVSQLQLPEPQRV